MRIVPILKPYQSITFHKLPSVALFGRQFSLSAEAELLLGFADHGEEEGRVSTFDIE
jgi:hypothetical protein